MYSELKRFERCRVVAMSELIFVRMSNDTVRTLSHLHLCVDLVNYAFKQFSTLLGGLVDGCHCVVRYDRTQTIGGEAALFSVPLDVPHLDSRLGRTCADYQSNHRAQVTYHDGARLAFQSRHHGPLVSCYLRVPGDKCPGALCDPALRLLLPHPEVHRPVRVGVRTVGTVDEEGVGRLRPGSRSCSLVAAWSRGCAGACAVGAGALRVVVVSLLCDRECKMIRAQLNDSEVEHRRCIVRGLSWLRAIVRGMCITSYVLREYGR